MPDSGEVSTSSSAVSFASVWAGLAARTVQDEPAWLDDGLGDDVATLTYEQALRRHGRGRLHSSGAVQTGAPMAEDDDADGAPLTAEERLESGEDSGLGDVAGRDDARHRAGPSCGLEGRKVGSITVRMSAAECAQVHARAAEAGMTTSAYLRSCVFDAESLRAQVKEALAELRSTGMAQRAMPEQVKPERGSRWAAGLFPRWGRRGGAA